MITRQGLSTRGIKKVLRAAAGNRRPNPPQPFLVGFFAAFFFGAFSAFFSAGALAGAFFASSFFTITALLKVAQPCSQG